MARKFDYSKHLYKTKIYNSWSNMKTRCDNPKYNQFHRYGARGIAYHAKWKKFSDFYADMKDTYQDGLSLDRIDNNKGYSKENCKWSNRTEQARNTKNTESARRYKFKGKSLTIRELSELTGLKRSTISQRLIVYGWSLERALTESVG